MKKGKMISACKPETLNEAYDVLLLLRGIDFNGGISVQAEWDPNWSHPKGLDALVEDSTRLGRVDENEVSNEFRLLFDLLNVLRKLVPGCDKRDSNAARLAGARPLISRVLAQEHTNGQDKAPLPPEALACAKLLDERFDNWSDKLLHWYYREVGPLMLTCVRLKQELTDPLGERLVKDLNREQDRIMTIVMQQCEWTSRESLMAPG